MHEGGAFRDVAGVGGVVAHHQYRETAVLPESAEQIQHLVAQRRPERGEGLVEEQHRAPAHKDAGQRDALSLAAGELPGAPAIEAGQPDPFEGAVDLGVVLCIQPQGRVQSQPHGVYAGIGFIARSEKC